MRDFVGLCPECAGKLDVAEAGGPPGALARHVSKMIREGLEVERVGRAAHEALPRGCKGGCLWRDRSRAPTGKRRV